MDEGITKIDIAFIDACEEGRLEMAKRMYKNGPVEVNLAFGACVNRREDQFFDRDDDEEDVLKLKETIDWLAAIIRSKQRRDENISRRLKLCNVSTPVMAPCHPCIMFPWINNFVPEIQKGVHTLKRSCSGCLTEVCDLCNFECFKAKDNSTEIGHDPLCFKRVVVLASKLKQLNLKGKEDMLKALQLLKLG